MAPLTATAAIAAPDAEQNANPDRRGTSSARHGATSSAIRHAHIAATPTANQSRLFRLESTIGAQTNSKVNASEVAAMTEPTLCTVTPARTRLLLNASPTTPTGHAVHAC